MAVLCVNLGSKNSTVQVVTKTFTVENKEVTKKNFPVIPLKEVTNRSPKLIVLASSTISASTLGVVMPVSAANVQNQVISTDLMEFMLGAIVSLEVIGIGIALGMYTISGIVTYFNPDLGKKWITNITRGVGIITFMQMSIVGLVFLGHLMFGGSDYYIDPWKYFGEALKTFNSH